MKIKWFIPLFLLLSTFLIPPLTSSATIARSDKPLIPTIQQVPCDGEPDQVSITGHANSPAGPLTTLCYAGTSYAGISPNLYEVSAFSAGENCGWIRVYDLNGTGSYLEFSSYELAQIEVSHSSEGYFVFNKITQINIHGTFCNGFYP